MNKNILQDLSDVSVPMAFPTGLLEEWLKKKSIPFIRKKNGWLVMRCLFPTHSDKHPSFNIHSINGGYNCWGCGRHGNWSNLCEQMGWMSDPSVPIHTFLYNVGTESDMVDVWKDLQPEKEKTHKEFPLPAGYRVIEFKNPNCHKHLLYLNRRRLLASARNFKIGYTLETDVVYHRMFVNRLIIPVHDEHGNFVWPEGRAIYDNVKPKYYRPADTPKTNILFNLHRVKNKKSVFVIEGLTDVLQLSIWGIPAVCSFGTILSFNQIKLLGRYFEKIYLGYDNDSAGREGYARNVAALKQLGIELWKFTLPVKRDFNSLTESEFRLQYKMFTKRVY